MKSGDRVIGPSGHRESKNLFTAETRRRGEQIPIHHGGTETRRKPGNWVQNAWKVWCAAMGEIFDQSAYERFLLRTRAPRSGESYRAFMREKEAGMARRPKCC